MTWEISSSSRYFPVVMIWNPRWFTINLKPHIYRKSPLRIQLPFSGYVKCRTWKTHHSHRQDHAKAVRLVKPETPQMDVAGVAGMAGAMPRFQAIHAEDLMKALMLCMQLSNRFFDVSLFIDYIIFVYFNFFY